MFKKNFAKAKTRLKFYNELVKNFSEKFFKILCQQKIANHIRLFIINQKTKTFLLLKFNHCSNILPKLK